MKKIYLKTSKLNLKDENDISDLINLGDWCYDLKKKLSLKSSYYLKNNELKFKHFKYSSLLKEKIFFSLVEYLNHTHQIKKNYKYWNFLIGPWLIQLLHVLHDRWISIENNVSKSRHDLFTIICQLPQELIIPNEMLASKYFYYQDLWNHYIFGEIIKYKNQISYTISNQNFENLNEKFKREFIDKSLKKKFFNILFNFSQMFYSEKKINKIIFSSDLHYKFQIKTLLNNKQFPIFLKDPPDYNSNKVNLDLRSEKIFFKTNNDFEKFISANLLKFLPKSILENYSLIQNSSSDFYKKFKSENYFIPQIEVCDQLKFFLSSQENSKKIIYQHGGVYGFIKFHFRELIEIQMSDYYLTFGWTKDNSQANLDEKEKEKIVDFFPVHLSKKKIDTRNNKMIYLILDEFPNYFLEYAANIDSHSYKFYFQNIINFITNLHEEVRKNLTVRLYPSKYHKDAYKILKENFPNIAIDDGSQNIMINLQNSKLIISSSNSTTYLNTLGINIPTILFWDQKIVETRETSMKYLKLLKEADIFYDTPEDAALFCNNIKNIYNWWNNKKRQNIIKEFLNVYANQNEKKIKKLFSIINEKKKN